MKLFIEFLKKNKKNLLVLFFSYLIFFSSFWIKKTFGSHVYYVEVIYNLFVNIAGVKDSPLKYKIDFILYVVNLSIFSSLVTVYIVEKIKVNFKLNIKSLIFKIFLNYNIFILVSLTFFLYQFKFHEYFKSYIVYEDHSYLYKDPYKINYNNPQNKKNLIIMYIESLEYGIQDLSKIVEYKKMTEDYERFEKNPIALLKDIDGKNIYDFKEAPPNGFSIGALVSSQCSVPFYPSVSTKLKELKGEKMFCLSDVLNRYGYKQYHFMTVFKEFHGTYIFKENHHYTVFDNEKIRKEYPNAADGWAGGVFDDVLLDAAKKKILELSKKNELFNIIIKTTDTHPPYYLSPKCDENRTGILEVNAHIAFECTSKFINNFFKELDAEGVLDNTVVVVMGDHLAYDHLMKLYRSHPSRNIFFKMNTKKEFKRSKMIHYDIAPTILEEMGYLPKDIDIFGLGVSLFNENKNFNYDNHYNSIMDKNIISDFFIRQALK